MGIVVINQPSLNASVNKNLKPKTSFTLKNVIKGYFKIITWHVTHLFCLYNYALVVVAKH